MYIMTSWREHIAAYRKKHGVTYKDAMTAAGPSWRALTAVSVKDKSTKGRKSKTHKGDKDFTTKKGDKDHHRGGKDVKEKKKPYAKVEKTKPSPCGCGGH